MFTNYCCRISEFQWCLAVISFVVTVKIPAARTPSTLFSFVSGKAMIYFARCSGAYEVMYRAVSIAVVVAVGEGKI
jgi:hypothetical protein